MLIAKQEKEDLVINLRRICAEANPLAYQSQFFAAA
jgi:hypothetical protein